MRSYDLVNKKIGKIKVIRKSNKKNNHNWYLWECECDCGNICYATTQQILNGHKKTCGCGKRPNLIGLKTGMLEVVSYAGIHKIDKTHSEKRWRCLCQCGNYTNLSTAVLTKGVTKSCGCLNKRKGKFHKDWTGYEDISGSLWNQIKICAKERNLKFNINIKYIWKLYVKQNKQCALSGIDIILGKNASLDRIDSAKGYVKQNVQWLDKDVNRIKSNLDEKYFIEICNKITQYKKLKRKN
jgi:hypothetical protein